MSEPAAPESSSFLDWLAVHREMFELLLLHQEALLAGDYGRALERLLELRRRFEEHVGAEELLFRELFAEVDQVRGTPLDLFTGEHKHLRELLGEFATATRALDATDPTVARRVIELIEEEALFKAFFRHHDEREQNLLYPALNQGTTDAQRKLLLRRFHTSGRDGNGPVPAA